MKLASFKNASYKLFVISAFTAPCWLTGNSVFGQWKEKDRKFLMSISKGKKIINETLQNFSAPQDPAQDQPAPVTGVILKTTVEWVALSVRVLDKNGLPYKDLVRDDFEVIDNGARQKDFYLDHGDGLASASLMIDVAMNQGKSFDDIQNFRDFFIQEFQKRNAVVGLFPFAAGSICYVRGFMGTILMKSEDISRSFNVCYDDFKQSRATVYQNLYQLEGELFQLLAWIANYNRTERPLSKNAVFVIAEQVDNDTADWVKKDLPQYSLENRVVIYPILVGKAKKAHRRMSYLAKATNGIYSEAKSLDDLRSIFAADLLDLDSLYVISYPVPLGGDGTIHNVQIRIPAHPEFQVSTRNSYVEQR